MKLFTGDLFADARVTAFAHGCNCAGAMGKGIAVAFKGRWPAMFDEYRRRCQAGEFRPGALFVWEEASVVVYNLGTQNTWRTKATMEAVETSARAMIGDAEERGLAHVALPRIGAGLGGLDWIEVRGALECLSDGSSGSCGCARSSWRGDGWRRRGELRHGLAVSMGSARQPFERRGHGFDPTAGTPDGSGLHWGARRSGSGPVARTRDP